MKALPQFLALTQCPANDTERMITSRAAKIPLDIDFAHYVYVNCGREYCEYFGYCC